jgi:hypothetical protein
MPIKFVTNSYQTTVERKTDIRRLLHVAFDFGYLFEPAEIELAWLEVNPGDEWAPLPERDNEIWFRLQKYLEAAIAEGATANQVDQVKPKLIHS